MRMSGASVSRRAALRFAAASIAGIAGVSLASDISLKELKKDVEELKYDEEVTDVGPDDREKNVTRTKKKVEEPKFRVEEKELLAEDENNFDEMVAEELEEEKKLKAKFSKPKN